MINLEQVKLLDSKVAKAVDYVRRVTGENRRLETTLESYQKRIDELEVLMRRFKEDQGKIEEGILAALDRLNQFEDAIEKSVPPVSGKAAPPAPPPAAKAEEPESAEEDGKEGEEADADIDIELTAIEAEEEEAEEEPDEKGGEAELDIF
jgi:hypothetical protein